jgi:HAD superfamily hydrolase (TIGR01549 family)
MDGTLCRSVIDFKRMRQRLGILGQPIDLIDFCTSRPTPEERKAAWSIIEDEERIGAEQCQLHDGLSELLEHLDQNQIRKAVITRNSQAAVDVFMRLMAARTSSQFELVLTRDHPSGVKPSPNPTLHVCDQWGLPPSQCLFVGDATDDMTSGHLAGCRTCLLTQDHNAEMRPGWPHESTRPRPDWHPHVHAVVDRLDHIIPMLDDWDHGVQLAASSSL